MNLPDPNRRIKQIIDYKAGGSVNKFAELIGVSQQKLNRLFNIDNRTQKYPSVTSDILTCITELFVDIDSRWLLTGHGSMLEHSGPSKESIEDKKHNTCEICKEKDKRIELLESQLKESRNDFNWVKQYVDINCEPGVSRKQRLG